MAMLPPMTILSHCDALRVRDPQPRCNQVHQSINICLQQCNAVRDAEAIQAIITGVFQKYRAE